MGLKTTNYKVQQFNLVLSEAYAKITDVIIDPKGNATATFAIQQSRDAVDHSAPLTKMRLNCQIDKDLPIYEQIYKTSKIMMFKDWEDDIVEEIEVIEPDYVEEEEKEEEKTESEVE